MKLTTGLIAIGAVFLLNVLLIIFGLDIRFPWVDAPLHFLGGFTVAILGAGLITRAKILNQSGWFDFLFLLGFALIIGSLWEGLEFVVEPWLDHHDFWVMLSVTDTLGDLLADGLGAIAFAIIYYKKINLH